MSLSEYPIHVDQLCVGVYVRLSADAPVPSTMRKGGFKITSDEQIQTIKKSGLSHVVCVMNKSDRLPIPIEAAADGTGLGLGQRGMKTPVSLELLNLKQQTLNENTKRKQKFAKCEKQYDEQMTAVSTILRRASGRAPEAFEEAGKVVKALVSTFLSERDVLVNLINSKPTEDKQNYHALNVTVLSMMIGKEMQLDAPAMNALGMGALFHDLGKGRMPINELTRGKATSMQMAVQRHYQLHPVTGARLAADMASVPRASLPVILHHHEAMNGSGFPKRLAGEQIPLLARVLTVVDRYDNLCNGGLEETPLTPHESLKRMFSKEKALLDNRILSLFIRNLGVYPPGSVVQLSNGLLGMVISTNLKKSTRPCVLVYHPEVPKKEALVIDLDIEQELAITKAMRPDDLPREVHNYLSPSRQLSYYADTA